MVTTVGKIPRWAINLAKREAKERETNISVRWMRCSRGCPHGRAFRIRNHIRIYASSHDESNKYLLIHELAHLAPGGNGHGPMFYSQAIRIAKREKCIRGFLNWQGNRAKAFYRRMKREDQ